MTNPWKLSDREVQVMQVLAGVAEGNGKKAAKELGISIKTVEVHVARINFKMGVTTRLAAVLLWDRTYRTVIGSPPPGVVHCMHCDGLGFLRAER